MADSNTSSGSRSYIEEKVVSVSRQIGIHEESLLRTTFEEIEKRLGITDENIFESKSRRSQSTEKTKGSIFAHFASPILERDTARKQEYINRFFRHRGTGK